MTENPSRFKYVLTRVLISLSLISLLWVLVQRPGTRIEQAQSSADTRIYFSDTSDGLSLTLDLRLPQPPLVSSPPEGPEGLAFSPAQPHAEPESESPNWPSYLLGILLLAAGAGWFLRQKLDFNPSANAERFPHAGDTPDPNYDSVFFASEHDETQTTQTEQGVDISIDLLKKHIGQNPGDSIAPWLLLLDLLHRKDEGPEYENIRKQCKQHFNVNMPPYKKIKAGLHKRGIESYPHIMNKLIQLWPSEETSSYLNALLHDCRDGSRAGFDLATYHDIVLLRSVLENTAGLHDS